MPPRLPNSARPEEHAGAVRARLRGSQRLAGAGVAGALEALPPWGYLQPH